MLQDLSAAILSVSVFNEHPIKVLNNCTYFDFSRFWRKLLSQVVKKMLKQKKHIFPSWCLTYCKQIQRLPHFMLADWRYVKGCYKEYCLEIARRKLIGKGILDLILSSGDRD